MGESANKNKCHEDKPFSLSRYKDVKQNKSYVYIQKFCKKFVVWNYSYIPLHMPNKIASNKNKYAMLWPSDNETIRLMIMKRWFDLRFCVFALKLFF